MRRVILMSAVCGWILASPFASHAGAGNCLEFDGTNDYVQAAGLSPALTNITLEAWVYQRTLGASVQRYVTVGDEVAVIRYNVGSGQPDGLHFYIKTGGTLKHLAAGNVLPTGAWHHVAGSWDGSIMALYLDGNLLTSSTPGGTLTAPDGTLTLSNPTETLDGSLDEVRVWSVARGEAQIRPDMSRRLIGDEAGLAAYYPMDQSGAMILDDVTSHNVNGTLYGTPVWASSGAPIDVLTLETNAALPATGQLSGKVQADAGWGDFDGDGLLDIVISGYQSLGVGKLTALLRNDGGGAFTNVGANVENTSNAALKWADMDGDNDLDLVLCGASYTTRTEHWTLIYRNDLALGGDFVLTDPGVTPVFQGDVDVADFDQDGSQDLVLANDGEAIQIWVNHGGAFTNIASGLPSVGSFPRLAAGDYDNDGYPDLAAGGSLGVFLFHNDLAGSGSFTNDVVQLSANTIARGDLAWGDYDNDGDLDLAVAEQDFVRLFRNDVSQGGSLTNFFTEADGQAQSLAWGDFDNDGDLDLLVTGQSDGLQTTTLLYRNDGNDAFTDVRPAISGAMAGYAGWGDYDRDGDLDLLVVSDYLGDSNKVYRNEITVSNTPPTAPGGLMVDVTPSTAPCGELRWDVASDAQTPASGLEYNVRLRASTSSVYLVSGMANTNTGARLLPGHGNCAGKRWMRMNTLANTGTTYIASVQAIDTAWEGSPWSGEIPIEYSDISASPCTLGIQTEHALPVSTSVQGDPIDGCGLVWGTNANPRLPDDFTGNYEAGTHAGAFSVVLTNLTAGVTYQIRSYARRGNVVYYGETVSATGVGPWTPMLVSDVGEVTNLATFTHGRIATGDYDNDGDLDLAVSTGPQYEDTVLLRNDGDLGFAQDVAVAWRSESGQDWGDVDGDGDLDLLVGGSQNNMAALYSNNVSTAGGFTLAFTNGYTFYDYNDKGDAGLVDVDSDGDLDLMVCGTGATKQYMTRVMLNTGGSYTDLETSIEPLYDSRFAWGDYDNDGDLDLVFGGRSVTGFVCRIYRNDLPGGGGFVPVAALLQPTRRAPFAWGDYDGDGDLDVLEFSDSGTTSQLRLYRNEGADAFVEVTGTGLPGPFINAYALSTTVAWADANNDGKLDVLFAASYMTPDGPAVYLNQGDGTFVKQSLGLESNTLGEGVWGDFDNDGDLDAAFVGRGGTYVFRNNRDFDYTNIPPAAPSGLSMIPSGTNAMRLSWNAATDTETPSQALTYNVRIGTTPYAENIMSGSSDPTSGIRRLARFGNVNLNTNWTLRGLSDGLYYWSVQAVDNGFEGGSWASEDSFYVRIDTDNDGISDAWETQYFGGPTNANATAMASNAVNTVLETYIADLDPNDPASVFRITAISNGPPTVVFFEASSNRLYTLIGCSNLLDTAWTNVLGGGPRAGAGGAGGAGGADSITDTNPPSQDPFYRIQVTLP